MPDKWVDNLHRTNRRVDLGLREFDRSNGDFLMPKSSKAPKVIVSGWLIGVIVLCAGFGGSVLLMNSMAEDAAGGRDDSERVLRMEAEKMQKTTVIKATRDIKDGAVIELDDLEEVSIQTSRVPDGAIESRVQGAGKYASRDIAQGTVLTNLNIQSAAASKPDPKNDHRRRHK